MPLLKAFWNSIQLPKKEAMFALNRTKMGGTLAYLFILFFVISVPEGVRFVLSNNQTLPLTLMVLQFIIFGYFLFLFVGMCFISIMAGICMGISVVLKRKLVYRHLWKLAAYAATLPLILYGVATSFSLLSSLIPLGLFLLSLVMLIRMISIFPKRNR